MYYYTCFVLVAFMITEIYTQSANREVSEYFRCAEVSTLSKIWKTYRRPMENAISGALQDSIGMGGTNVYVKKNVAKLPVGYYHNDNLVHLILSGLDMVELPRLWKPHISFALASNILKVEAYVSKIILQANYMVFRNKSDIIYDREKQNSTRASPFLFEQVSNVGDIAISMDRCMLTGFITVSLSGESVNLGHNHLKLTKCQYNLEIFKQGLGAPPVVAKYYPIGSGLGLHQLVMDLIYTELQPKLQGAVFSFVNISDIFGEELPRLIKKQHDIFEVTAEFISKVVRNVNSLMVSKLNGHMALDEALFIWDDSVKSVNVTVSKLKLYEMMVSGLDTLYSARAGGPYRLMHSNMGDEIRFNSVQIRGKVSLQSGPDAEPGYEFAAGFEDVAVDIGIGWKSPKTNLNGTDPKTSSLVVRSIRNIEFSLPGIVLPPLEPIITGYLLNEVPKQLQAHLLGVFDQAIKQANQNEDEGNAYFSSSSNTQILEPMSRDERSYEEIDLYQPSKDYRRHHRKGKKSARGRKKHGKPVKRAHTGKKHAVKKHKQEHKNKIKV